MTAPITKVMLEDEEQIFLMQWIATQPKIRDYILHIPNQRVCSVGYRKKLARMGVRKGVSDLFLAYPTQKYHGLWIEMKRREKYTVDAAQTEWIERMRNVGFQAAITYGWEEAKNLIENYVSNRM